MKLLLEAFWLFIPILAANQASGIARGLRLPLSTTPLSIRWFGENKTLAGYYMSPALAVATAYLCGFKNFLILGIFTGLGAILGDHIESFIKRRLGMKPGAPWWPFDQVDYALGGLAGSYFVVEGLWIGQGIFVLLFALLIHPIGNGLGYRLGFRKTPW